MRSSPPLAQTIESIVREREPNFLRLYLNPHLAQTCLALDRYVRSTWEAPAMAAEVDFQSFLANGIEEAISGALKLLRSRRGPGDPPPTTLILDPADRISGFASVALEGGDHVAFLPNVRTLGGRDVGRPDAADVADRVDFLVLVAGDGRLLDERAGTVRDILRRHAPKVVTCVDRAALRALRAEPGRLLREVAPEVVVFDESFTDRAVPFAAITAGRPVFAEWNRRSKSTFHSTTFQPNTISTRHFMDCLAVADPEFVGRHAFEFRALRDDLDRRVDAISRHYNPSLVRLIRAAGFETADVHAEGAFVVVNGQPIFDVVGGVACSMRGHNPPGYTEETAPRPTPGGPDPEAELSDRLRRLTGLGCVLPAVSGASAVENALKLALVDQFPRRHILALRSGFGGKTLLALTGTANAKYKEGIGPLYPDVHYVDPFATDAASQIDSLMGSHDFAVVQLELIQSVGGVRPIPDAVVRKIDEARRRHGALLLVDEVQTGMHRTGPFCRSTALGLAPDLLLLGKGTSDMMFPFALTLCSDALAERLDRRCPTLIDAIRRRFGYEQGYRTVANLLRDAEAHDLTRQVEEAAERFRVGLMEGPGASRNIRDVRIFGLLIGIELETRRGPRRWLGKRLAALTLLAMLRHRRFPVFAGFCQYEPNVLKITPPLDAEPDQIRDACRTILEVLNAPLPRLLAVGLASLIKSSPIRKEAHEHAAGQALEPATR